MQTTSCNWIALGSLALCLPLLGACASQKTLQNYEDEIAALREERTRLKKDLHQKELQLDDYEVQLAEANVQLQERPEQPNYQVLDDLGIGYGTRGGNMVISVPSEVTFPSGKAEVTKSGREALKTVAQILQTDYADGIYWIEGHTDTDPIRKSNFESNRHLSMMRAMAVLHFLVEDCGVPDAQCVVAGHGEYAPVAANDSKENKARNRRVEIVVHAAGA